MSDHTGPMETGQIESILQNMNAYNPAASEQMREHLAAFEAELEKTQYGLAMTQHYWINPMEYEEDRVKRSKRAEALQARLSKMEEALTLDLDAVSGYAYVLESMLREREAELPPRPSALLEPFSGTGEDDDERPGA